MDKDKPPDTAVTSREDTSATSKPKISAGDITTTPTTTGDITNTPTTTGDGTKTPTTKGDVTNTPTTTKTN